MKFGRDNGEVYAEVAATRLFWALGFPADHMYPVRVRCEGCPAGKEATREDASGLILFDPASIERKFKGQAHRDQARLRLGLAGTRSRWRKPPAARRGRSAMR